ncbi:hypothetical protein FACS1894179_06290 [Bacteroidia bacterium]|nr:hypothetical protein FACS1894179_06290 [Bacteroidia bacterium]
MRAFKLYLCIAVVTLSLGLSAQSNPVYKQAVEKGLATIDSAKSVKDLSSARNQFERISMMYTDEWLPPYYMAYVDILSVYMGQKNEKALENAKTNLDKLSSYAKADKSELNTLLGYYYMALIMLDPATNGQKYFNNVNISFSKALEQNPDNPRAVYLSAFFEQNLPEGLRSGKDFCAEMNRAKDLYAKEQKSVDKPYWGEYFLNMISEKCK